MIIYQKQSQFQIRKIGINPLNYQLPLLIYILINKNYQYYNQNYIQMSNNDNGLYEFLKGKSLFSPTKPTRKRSRSRSRGPREYENSSNSPTDRNQTKNNPLFNNNPNINTTSNYNNYNPNINSYNNTNSYNHPRPVQLEQPPQRNFSPLDNAPKTQLGYTPALKLTQESEVGSVRWGETTSQVSQASQNNLWTGILSYSNSFESARVESTQCLQNLSMKIRRELSTIHTKIDVFNSRMAAVLANQFRSVREKIHQVLEAAFKESDKYVHEYMKQKEAILAGELHQMKALLEKELTKVDAMKEELAKPHWRKVAGEILTTDLEHKVEELLQKSSTLEVGKWELGDLGSYRIKNIESQLREIVRLKA